ncbi:Uncharacterized protein dnl_12810 [Desulfonema limicola]|uniref:Uncharacterized protein n=1 Tax=Desulfonema limicola TaxID=45656 RepID=A0A975GFC7_9BACT|nr:Uncharacterized protein dnl_12810 [Desulfonema limicola]
MQCLILTISSLNLVVKMLTLSSKLHTIYTSGVSACQSRKLSAIRQVNFA